MDELRIDKWLWFARFCKSRSLAQHWIDAGETWVNGRQVDKVSAVVRIGDEVTFRQGRRWRRVVVVATAVRRGPATEAQALYQELAPPDPPPAED
ncbi:RNA-binding S4 domain-containing protein [Telmatospirillum sp.]|uniref:RNA-binding S4 domain-containing protein n=1 Tax=Telmatospirillum sp. TaxID=2079197 RepID=UPI00284C235E|nr:RNA-binding S4 domain-containing protein [Telmatospirillum sp.]MDR3440245.1 RNA-binding S4 domain-containing protein [Telmatospirillum sp.]